MGFRNRNRQRLANTRKWPNESCLAFRERTSTRPTPKRRRLRRKGADDGES